MNQTLNGKIVQHVMIAKHAPKKWVWLHPHVTILQELLVCALAKVISDLTKRVIVSTEMTASPQKLNIPNGPNGVLALSHAVVVAKLLDHVSVLVVPHVLVKPRKLK